MADMFLLGINDHSLEVLRNKLKDGKYSLSDYEKAGLSEGKLLELSAFKRQEEEKERASKSKAQIISRLGNPLTSFIDINNYLDSSQITINDFINDEIPSSIGETIRKYRNGEINFDISNEGVTSSEDFPELPGGRMDLYFIGLASSGKSTLLAGLLHEAHKSGRLKVDGRVNWKGNVYSQDLIENLNQGVVPEPTETGRYIFIESSLCDDNNEVHPLNLIEVPGERWEIMNTVGRTDELKHLVNENQKVMFFVIDVNPNRAIVRQSTAFNNLLTVFKENGVLDQTLAVYIIVNKFDLIDDQSRSYPGEPEPCVGLNYFNEHFLSFKNNLIAHRENGNLKFEIILFPYSIGDVWYGKFVSKLNRPHAANILNQMFADTFSNR